MRINWDNLKLQEDRSNHVYLLLGLQCSVESSTYLTLWKTENCLCVRPYKKSRIIQNQCEIVNPSQMLRSCLSSLHQTTTPWIVILCTYSNSQIPTQLKTLGASALQLEKQIRISKQGHHTGDLVAVDHTFLSAELERTHDLSTGDAGEERKSSARSQLGRRRGKGTWAIDQLIDLCLASARWALNALPKPLRNLRPNGPSHVNC